jgi:hypothetical protein
MRAQVSSVATHSHIPSIKYNCSIYVYHIIFEGYIKINIFSFYIVIYM